MPRVSIYLRGQASSHEQVSTSMGKHQAQLPWLGQTNSYCCSRVHLAVERLCMMPTSSRAMTPTLLHILLHIFFFHVGPETTALSASTLSYSEPRARTRPTPNSTDSRNRYVEVVPDYLMWTSLEQQTVEPIHCSSPFYLFQASSGMYAFRRRRDKQEHALLCSRGFEPSTCCFEIRAVKNHCGMCCFTQTLEERALGRPYRLGVTSTE